MKIKRVLFKSGWLPYYLDNDDFKYFDTLKELKEHHNISKIEKDGKGFAVRNGKTKTWDEYKVIK